MTLAVLAVVIFVMVPFAWVSAFVLAHAARGPRRIGALTERAVIAFAIAIMVTTGALLTYNRSTDSPVLTVEGARILFSLSLIVIGAIPVFWTALWLTGRLGDGRS